MRGYLVPVLGAAFILGITSRAFGQEPAPGVEAREAPISASTASAAPREAIAELARLRKTSIATRRSLSIGVVSAGVLSVIGGVVLVIPETHSGASRVAGINTLAFGGVNVIVGAIALAGIRAEEREWEEERVGERSTREGLQRHLVHALADERREAVSHGINLGLGVAYTAAGIATVFASQFGVDNPQRWLASGISIGAQGLFLIGIDAIGTIHSGYQYQSIEELLFSSLGLSVGPTGASVSVTRPL